MHRDDLPKDTELRSPRLHDSMRRISGRSMVIVLATLAFGAVLAMSALASPAYRTPDEPQHLSTALRLATGGGYPDPGTAWLAPAVEESFLYVDFPGTDRVFDGEPVRPRPADLPDPSLAELRERSEGRPSVVFDQMTQHPPLYYAVLAVAIRVLDLEQLGTADAVLVLRLLSAAMLLPVPYLCMRAADLVGLPARAATAAAFVPVGWTQLTHIGSGLNNGTPLVLAGCLLAVLLLRVVAGDTSKRLAVAVGLTLGLSLLVKGFALGFTAPVLVAYAVAARIRGVAPALRAGLLAALVALPGYAWWVTNVVRFGTVQPYGDPRPLRRVGDLSVVEFWVEFLNRLSHSWYANLGWSQTPPPVWVHVPLTLALVVLVALGTWALRRRMGAVLVLHLLWVPILAIVAYGSFNAYLTTGVVDAVHGRYLQPAAATLAVLAVAGLWELPAGRTLVRGVPLVASIAAIAGVAIAIRFFWTPGSLPWGVPATWWGLSEWWLPALALTVLASGLLAAIRSPEVDDPPEIPQGEPRS